jgi:hypothetical protein
MDSDQTRAALALHWAASDASDFEAGHQIYRGDAVLEYPQPGERIRGRRSDLWVTEFILTYDGQPSCTVSIMELEGGKVARETQYFGDAFEPGPSRAQWAERMR